jgi:Cu2+-exporting ATPase
MIQGLLGVRDALRFPGDSYLQLALSSAVFFYGGWPFLTGLVRELRKKQPGMMTLIAVAITVAYAYSTVVVLGVPGRVFFWELATLVDVMLLGHWMETRSVMGASRALEKLAKLMPSEAHRLWLRLPGFRDVNSLENRDPRVLQRFADITQPILWKGFRPEVRGLRMSPLP